MRWFGALGRFLTWSSLFASPAAATPTTTDRVLKLELEAPPGCPERQAILDAVVKLVQTTAETPLVARARIAEQDGRFYADLEMLGGQRRFDGASCRAVSEALVVILALTIDPEARANTSAFELAEPRPAATEQPTPEPVPKAEETPPPAPKPAAPRSSLVDESEKSDDPRAAQSVKLGGSAFVLGEFGMLPGPAVGALALARVGRSSWRLEIGGGLLLPRRETLASDPNASGELRWAAGQLNGCGVPGPVLLLCLGAELGRVYGQGSGVDNERPGGATWVAGVASASARLALGGDMAFEGRLAAAVPALRPTFSLDAEFLHRPAPVSGRILLGVAFR